MRQGVIARRMVRHEPPVNFLRHPPEDEPIFRFGRSLFADAALVWFEADRLVWTASLRQRDLTLSELQSVGAHVAILNDLPVRHLVLRPYFAASGAIQPAITFQDRCGVGYQREEPDFEPFRKRLAGKLRSHRPFVSIEGDAGLIFG
jgi:hypothetical protein